MTTDDDVIAGYRAELVAEAELAAHDLDEIEDHLRALAAELRASGHADAIREACRRLGEPAALAREHARVRSPFGAKLSRARAWSAAVLLALPTVLILKSLPVWGLASSAGLEALLSAAALIALVARRTWARPLVMAETAYHVITYVVLIATVQTPFVWLPLAALNIGALAFLVPWRRRELAPAGWALALLAPTFYGAYSSVVVYSSLHGNAAAANPLGAFAFACAIAAGCGVIMRARWAALACVGACCALLACASSIWAFTATMGPVSHAMSLTRIVVGAAAALVVAVVSWRTARSPLGTLRHVLD